MNALKVSLILGSGLLVAACGGGGADSTPQTPPPDDTPPPSGGIGRTGVAVGPISTFGSVVVNGVRFDTSNATFIVDDVPGTESDLSVGQVVLVKGSVDEDGVNGTADEVIYDDAVEGPVKNLDVAAGTFTVLGQTVVVEATTSFDDDFPLDGIEGLADGDIVEVSGFVDSSGSIVATRIELDDDNDDFEVKGFVESLDAAAFTFQLGSLVVDYSAATIDDDFPAGNIAEGDFVEVEGTIDPNDDTRLLASEVEYEDRFSAFEDDDDVEIEGIVTRFVDATDFDVNGYPVTTTSNTEYEDGTAAALGLDVRIEVEGALNSEGVIIADEIEFRPDNDSRVEAQVDAVDVSAGTLVILGITIETDSRTRFEDQSDADDGTPLGLDEISVGDYVEVVGSEFPAGSNTLLAAKLERDDDEGDVELDGIVDDISEPTVSVLGVTVETNASTEFEGSNDEDLTAAEFFAQVAVGDRLEVDGIESSATTIVADEVELEDD